MNLDELENETIFEYARRVGFWKLSCICFEFQIPNFVWEHFWHFAYRLHDLLCPEMWMIRIFPKYLDKLEEVKQFG
jgi:hypothetical protein